MDETSTQGASRITAMDVAREAGVSMSAVSRVFTPGASVSAKMRVRVMAAADKLGYQPNVLARSLMTQRTNLVGVILANYKNPVYLTVLDHFTQALQARGLRTLLLNVSDGQDLEDMARLVLQYSVDGLVVSAGSISPFITEQCLKRRIPLVAFARRPRRAKLHVVCADNVAGGHVAGSRLLASPHRKFGFLAGPQKASTTIERGKGFRAEIEEAGHRVIATAHAREYSYDAGTDSARELLSGPERPDAVFCANDLLAMALMDVARYEHGMVLPDELSVIGFDDVNLASAASYRLSTIRQPLQSMVQETVDILSQRINNWSDDWETRQLACTPVDRASIAPPVSV
ncbi:LacI family DNA-binding transcriptional regulator [Halovulum sp. GXIMD14794]